MDNEIMTTDLLPGEEITERAITEIPTATTGDCIKIHDTRNSDFRPTQYQSPSKGHRVYCEFKDNNHFGGLSNLNGAYLDVMTIAGWEGRSGGNINQLAFPKFDQKILYRQGNTTNDTWQAWKEVATTDQFYNKTQADERFVNLVHSDTAYVTDVNENSQIKQGYARTNTSTKNLPISGLWGVLQNIFENPKNKTGIQIWYPINGEKKGSVFVRSVENLYSTSSKQLGEWKELATVGAGAGATVDLSNYYTKSEVDSKTDSIASHKIVKWKNTPRTLSDVLTWSKSGGTNWYSREIDLTGLEVGDFVTVVFDEGKISNHKGSASMYMRIKSKTSEDTFVCEGLGLTLGMSTTTNDELPTENVIYCLRNMDNVKTKLYDQVQQTNTTITLTDSTGVYPKRIIMKEHIVQIIEN